MSLPTNIGVQPAQRRVDTAPGPGAQDWGPAPHGAGASGARIRSRTLVTLRWLAVVGQTAALLFVGLVLKLPVPWGLGFAVVALSAWLNLILTLTPAARRTTGPLDAAAQLAFDILQLAGFLFLTGGMTNPFAILLIAPATLAASALPPRHALALGALAVSACVVLAIWSMPLPWFGAPLELPTPYRIAAAAACISGIIFTAGYAWQATAESQRMELALNVTETVLAREQRLSALGGLAAAAAHELGTPLATIAVVAKELARELPDGPNKEDAWLLVAQAQRCRDILKRLTETPDTGDEMHERLTLLQFVKEVVEPYAAESEVRVEALVNGAPGVESPDMWRRPEILHAMTSIVENAFDFAKAEILVTARFDESSVTVEVRDDGPGFSPEVLAKLGEPYVTSRPGAEGSRTGHIGMGLGFFIAKTLLERTGAKVEFRNGRRGGAVVAAKWPRSRIEAPTAARSPDLWVELNEEWAKQ